MQDQIKEKELFKNNNVTIVTGNQFKLKEFQKYLGEQVKCQKIDLLEYQGEPEQIAIKKCQDAFKIIGKPVVVEDTSMCFNALNGLPGPYIKYYLEKLGHLGTYKIIDSYEDKSCYIQCTLAYMSKPNEIPQIFKGITKGTLIQPQYKEGFPKPPGWDPIFQPEGYYKSYNNLEKEIINKISPRGKSIQLLQQYINQQNK